MSFPLSFHLALLAPTAAHWLDEPPDLSSKDTTGQHAVDDPLLSCKQQVGGSSPPASSQNRKSQACSLALLGSMSFLAIGTDHQAALMVECRRTEPSRASAQVLLAVR